MAHMKRKSYRGWRVRERWCLDIMIYNNWHSKKVTGSNPSGIFLFFSWSLHAFSTSQLPSTVQRHTWHNRKYILFVFRVWIVNILTLNFTFKMFITLQLNKKNQRSQSSGFCFLEKLELERVHQETPS